MVSAACVVLLGAVLLVVVIKRDPGTGAANAGAPQSTDGPSSPGAEPALTAPEFANFLRWSDPATWGGKVPTAGEEVTIPKGKQVLLDVDAPTLKGLRLDGDLAFADRPTTLRVGFILVHGTLWVGSEATPFQSAATIVLDGAPKDDLKMGNMSMGRSVLAAMAPGRIEIHGKKTGRTWTRLAQTAEKGATTLSLLDQVGWAVGDLIVVASSDLDVDHKERVKVASVTTDGKTVTIDKPLANRHVSTVTSKTAGGVTRSVAERAEVGLLSHNIRITGPDDAATTMSGGHITVTAGGTLRLSDTELFHMGQAGLLARYPIHWHYAGDAKSSLVDNISVHDSFNRMVTIHRTNNVHVNGVVGDETYGHGLFLEDGVETGNVITNNLIMGTRFVPKGKKVLRKADAIPSEYWISNPMNTFKDNSAAGGDGAGFWYDFNFNSDNTNIFDAINLPFGLNQNSTAHSHLNHGADFGNAMGTGISVDGLGGDSRKQGLLANANVWKNEGFGIWVDGALNTENPMAANNGVAINCQDTVVTDGLLIGNDTANTGGEIGHQSGLVRFYHGQCDVKGTWMANFKQNNPKSSPDFAAIVDAAASSANFTNRVKGLRFFGDGYRVLFVSAAPDFDPQAVNHSHWFADMDGSVVGDSNPVYITNNSPLLRTSADRIMYSSVGHGYLEKASFGTVSPLNRGIVRVDFPDKVTITRADGVVGEGDAPGLNMGQRYTISGSRDSIGGLHVNGSDPGYVDLVFAWTGRADPQATYGEGGKKVEVKRASSVASLGVDGQFVVSGGKLYVRIKIGGSAIPFASGNASAVTNRDQRWEIK